MCEMVKNWGPVAGRVLLALIFVLSGFEKITGFEGTVGYIASRGLPLPQVAAAQRGDVGTFEHDPAFGRLGQAVDHAQQSGFAGAGAADHADKAARRNRKRRVVDRGFCSLVPCTREAPLLRLRLALATRLAAVLSD